MCVCVCVCVWCVCENVGGGGGGWASCGSRAAYGSSGGSRAPAHARTGTARAFSAWHWWQGFVDRAGLEPTARSASLRVVARRRTCRSSSCLPAAVCAIDGQLQAHVFVALRAGLVDRAAREQAVAENSPSGCTVASRVALMDRAEPVVARTAGAGRSGTSASVPRPVPDHLGVADDQALRSAVRAHAPKPGPWQVSQTGIDGSAFAAACRPSACSVCVKCSLSS